MHDWLKFNQNAIPPKIQNIPRYTEAGQYQMTAHLDYIPKWLADNDYDMNPAFQRGHVWTRDQQIAFVEFILRGGHLRAGHLLEQPLLADAWNPGDTGHA